MLIYSHVSLGARQAGGHFQDLDAPYSDHLCVEHGDVFDHPTASPSISLPPSPAPSPTPTSAPTPGPSSLPTATPTSLPTRSPTPPPTAAPSSLPSPAPSPAPSPFPSDTPTALPTPLPSQLPTALPTTLPTPLPTPLPTVLVELGACATLGIGGVSCSDLGAAGSAAVATGLVTVLTSSRRLTHGDDGSYDDDSSAHEFRRLRGSRAATPAAGLNGDERCVRFAIPVDPRTPPQKLAPRATVTADETPEDDYQLDMVTTQEDLMWASDGEADNAQPRIDSFYPAVAQTTPAEPPRAADQDNFSSAAQSLASTAAARLVQQQQANAVGVETRSKAARRAAEEQRRRTAGQADSSPVSVAAPAPGITAETLSPGAEQSDETAASTRAHDVWNL